MATVVDKAAKTDHSDKKAVSYAALNEKSSANTPSLCRQRVKQFTQK